MKSLIDIQNTPVLKKKEIQAMAEQEAREVIENARVDLIPIAVQASRVKEYVESFIKTIKDSDEAINEARQLQSSMGAKIEVAELGVKYDYSSTPYIAQLEAKIAGLGEVLKSIQSEAKNCKEYKEISIEGEMIPIYPATKTSTTGIKITL